MRMRADHALELLKRQLQNLHRNRDIIALGANPRALITVNKYIAEVEAEIKRVQRVVDDYEKLEF